MNFLSFTWGDYTLFGAMFGLSAIVGIYYGCFGKNQHTTTGYLLGGKKMSVFPVAMSLVASTLSGISLLATPAEIYMYGTQFMIMIPTTILTGFFVNSIFLPVFWRLQVTTIFEYLEMRFDRTLRITASILFTFCNFIYLPLVIYAPSLAFNHVTGFDLHLIAVVMSSICIFYTTIGGLKAVVWADTLQFSVTLCTLGFVLIMGTISAGGVGAILQKSVLGQRIEFFNMDPDPTVRTTFWCMTIGTFFTGAAYIGVSPATAQRFLSVRTLNDSRKVLITYILVTMITKIISCFSGLIMYAKYFDCDPLSAGYIKRSDQILPYYVLDVAALIPGLSGLFVAGLFSTALSTLSTFLNTLAGIIYADFVAPFMPLDTSDRKASTIMKIITVLIGFVSVALIFVVERLGTLLEVMTSFNGITMGPLLGLFTLGMVFPTANRKGALCGVVVSLLFMLVVVSRNKMHVWSGGLTYVTKPLSTQGCNATLPDTTPLSSVDAASEVFWLFRLTFHYYILMGTVVTLVVGLGASWVARTSDDFLVDPKLFSPCVQGFVRRMAAKSKPATVEAELCALNKKNENEFE